MYQYFYMQNKIVKLLFFSELKILQRKKKIVDLFSAMFVQAPSKSTNDYFYLADYMLQRESNEKKNRLSVASISA